MISKCYQGLFQSMVPSVGSRLAGVVSPSYRKPKLIVRFNRHGFNMSETNDSRIVGGIVELQDADTNAQNPRHVSRRQKAREKNYREFLAIKGTGLSAGSGKPRLIAR